MYIKKLVFNEIHAIQIRFWNAKNILVKNKKKKIDSYIDIFRLKILDTIEGVALVLGSNGTDKQITCIYCKKRHISLKWNDDNESNKVRIGFESDS
jgi:hypothetical protein